ncbi:MAG: signal peptidase II [Oscillospiraceae bacterium]|jgi:signal peptidase II|nr:signal peptidase II [Oscillospiraceae bacterium]
MTGVPPRHSKPLQKLWLLLALPAVALDQLVKRWITQAAEARGFSPLHFPFLPGLNLTYTENTGAAFSLFRNSRWFLVAVSALAVALILFAVFKGWIQGKLGVASISCVLGGALGNLIDRAFLGYVVDMFEFTFVSFAIFNVADIFVTIGGICFCLYLLLESRKREPDAAVDENSTGQ